MLEVERHLKEIPNVRAIAGNGDTSTNSLRNVIRNAWLHVLQALNFCILPVSRYLRLVAVPQHL